MKLHNAKYIVLLALTLGLASGCEKFFGEKTDLGFIEVPVYQARDIAYVPIQPYITNLERPVHITIGFDELIYVVDEATEQIIAYDEALNEIGRLKVQGVTSVSQDRRFNLLAIGLKDTTINGTPYSLSTIYRINLQGSSGYGLSNASISNTITHPFYFKNSFSTSDAQVRFTQVAILGNNTNAALNNRYYVSRTGPSSNNAGQGPDDAIIFFDNEDNYISPVPVNTSGGLFNDYFKKPFGLTSLCQPPQITASNSPDFMFTSLDPGSPIKVQYIEFVEGEFGAEFRPIIFPVGNPIADGWLNSPDKFTYPTGITVAGDESRYIFVTDAEKDSVYQFTSNGLEGVPPPPGSGSVRYTKASFGGSGPGPTQFNEPRGVAYYNQILYVCDAGNHRICRFKLTLDFD
jgi:hypothetical protein